MTKETLKMAIDLFQTGAIIVTLLFSIWQWRKTRSTIKVDNFSKIISALNNIRRERLALPELERALFESRKDWDDNKIRRRIYGVMFANLIEWSIYSHESGLIDENNWNDWNTTLKEVILSDKGFAELLSDKTIYTFNFGAYNLVMKIIGSKSVA